MSAESINRPVADIMSRIFTLALRMAGFDGRVKVWFRHAELRPDLELEALRIQKQTRLLKDLSIGKISDEYYNLEMYGFLSPESAEDLSGTFFLNSPSQDPQVEDNDFVFDNGSPNGNQANPTPKDTPQGKQITPDDAASAKSNINKVAE